MEQRIKIGISACVLGQGVRFDSGHKANKFVTQELAPYCQFIAVCPEVGSKGASPIRPSTLEVE